MKKWLATLFVFLGLSGIAFAFQSSVWLSSNAAVNVSTQQLCNYGSLTEMPHAVLHGVCINTAAAGNIQIFNSSGTAVNTITGLFSTATQQPCNFYDVVTSSGLSVNKNGLADTTILYQCY